MDPVSKLIVAWDVGPRTQAMAQRLVHQVRQVLAPQCTPLFLTDGFREYMTALVTHYGQWIQPERHHGKGPRPKPRWMPRPQLLYAQVVDVLPALKDGASTAVFPSPIEGSGSTWV
jgi:hypothetical protein